MPLFYQRKRCISITICEQSRPKKHGHSVRQIVVWRDTTVGAANSRPQPSVYESTPFYRKHSKIGTFRAANSRPYGSNATCSEIGKLSIFQTSLPFSKTILYFRPACSWWGRLARWFMESETDYIRGSMPSTGWPFSVSQFSSSSQSVVTVSSATMSVKFSMP